MQCHELCTASKIEMHLNLRALASNLSQIVPNPRDAPMEGMYGINPWQGKPVAIRQENMKIGAHPNALRIVRLLGRAIV